MSSHTTPTTPHGADGGAGMYERSLRALEAIEDAGNRNLARVILDQGMALGRLDEQLDAAIARLEAAERVVEMTRFWADNQIDIGEWVPGGVLKALAAYDALTTNRSDAE